MTLTCDHPDTQRILSLVLTFDVTFAVNTIDHPVEPAIDTHPLPPDQPSLWQKGLAGATILAGLVCAVGGISINVSDRNFRAAPSMPTAQERQNEFYQAFDHNMDLAKEHSNGIFIRFLNFQGDTSQLALNAYFRAAYDLYPTLLRVGFSDAAINTAPQLMATNDKPDDDWMRDHGLDAELIMTFNPPLLLQMKLRSLDGRPPLDLPVVTGRPMILPPSPRNR